MIPSPLSLLPRTMETFFQCKSFFGWNLWERFCYLANSLKKESLIENLRLWCYNRIVLIIQTCECLRNWPEIVPLNKHLQNHVFCLQNKSLLHVSETTNTPCILILRKKHLKQGKIVHLNSTGTWSQGSKAWANSIILMSLHPRSVWFIRKSKAEFSTTMLTKIPHIIHHCCKYTTSFMCYYDIWCSKLEEDFPHKSK